MKCIAGVIKPIGGVITLLITGRDPSCIFFFPAPCRCAISPFGLYEGRR